MRRRSSLTAGLAIGGYGKLLPLEVPAWGRVGLIGASILDSMPLYGSRFRSILRWYSRILSFFGFLRVAK